AAPHTLLSDRYAIKLVPSITSASITLAYCRAIHLFVKAELQRVIEFVIRNGNSAMPPTKDQIYAEPLNVIAGFAFDERVVAVFPDMIQRSVPGYSTIIAMTGVLAERYAQPNTRCYDLGCSLGASLLAMRAQLDG